MELASETTQLSVARMSLATLLLCKGGDYNGQENCDDKKNKSRKDSEDK